MRKIHVSGAILSVLFAVACDGPLPAPISDDSTSDAGDAGSDAGDLRDAGHEVSDATDSSIPGDGGDAGDAATDVCGDGIRGSNEFCDGDDLRGSDCTSFGFTSGQLACNDSCNFDLSECSGVEVCFDGIDNDGDKQTDCNDPDCATTCASSCAEVTEISGDGLVNGNTTNQPSLLTSSCLASGAASGPELVFRVVAAQAGVLEARLTSIAADHTLSVRTSCVDDTAEAYCSNTGAGPGGLETVVVEVQQAEEVFLVIDGVGPDEAGAFALQTLTRPILCGDGIRDPGEACDDHNSDSDDGCSAHCVLESSEEEPNDTQGTAHPYGDLPVIGEISNVSDVDVFSIEIEQDDSTLSAETQDLGDGTCANLVLDDRIEILRSNGDVIATDDDSGDGFCAVASAENLNAGTYFVRVTASGVATAFPYRLRLSRSP